MRYIQVVVVVAIAVFILLVDSAVSDPPCSIEISAEKTKKQAYKWAQAEVTALTWQIWLKEKRRQYADDNFQMHKVQELTEEINKLEKKLTKLEESERRARDDWKEANRVMRNCQENAHRKCGCVKHHTLSQTDCGCDYNKWNRKCPCPRTPVGSPSQGGG